MGWLTWVLGAALVVVVVLSTWATPNDGRRWLQRWGVPDATEEQAELVAVHLRRRRLSYPVLVLASFLITPVVLSALDQRPSGTRFVDLAVVVVVALLVGEVADGLLQRRGAVREASLQPRSAAGLVPAWATWLLRGVAGYGLVVAGLGVGLALSWRADPVTSYGSSAVLDEEALRPFADLGLPVGVAVGLVLGVAGVELAVRLAVRRTPLPDRVVDGLLRARTARLATGAGLALVAGLTSVVAYRVHSVLGDPARSFAGAWSGPVGWVAGLSQVVLLLVAVGGWITVGSAPRRSGRDRTGPRADAAA